MSENVGLMPWQWTAIDLLLSWR